MLRQRTQLCVTITRYHGLFENFGVFFVIVIRSMPILAHMKPHPSYQSLLPALACLHDTPAHFLQAQSNVLGVGLDFKVADSDVKHLKMF